MTKFSPTKSDSVFISSANVTSAPPLRALGHAMQGFQRPSFLPKKWLDIKDFIKIVKEGKLFFFTLCTMFYLPLFIFIFIFLLHNFIIFPLQFFIFIFIPSFKILLFSLFLLHLLIFHIYYIDTSVLPGNIPLVKFINATSGTRVVYFP